MGDDSRPRKKWLIRLVGTILGIAVTVAMFSYYGARAVLEPLSKSDPIMLVLIVILLYLAQWLNAMSLVVLMEPLSKESASVSNTTRVFMAVQPLGLFGPGKLSDLAAIPMLKNHYPSGSVAGAVFMDRLVTVFVLVALFPIAALYLFDSGGLYTTSASALLLITIAMVVPVLAHPRVRALVNRTVLRRWPNLLQGFGDQMSFFLGEGRWRAGVNGVVRIVKLLVSALTLCLLARNVGVAVTFVEACVMSVLMQSATLVPISAMGLGVTEASLVALFSHLSLPPAAAISMMIVGRTLQLLVLLGIYLTTTLSVLADRAETNIDGVKKDADAAGDKLAS